MAALLIIIAAPLALVAFALATGERDGSGSTRLGRSTAADRRR
jgi:hypothetical protein